jgi:S-formylglutathione hydrolase FrmB
MEEQRGTVVIEAFESPALRGNPLGDPWQREVPVYLPPEYDADASRRYPTIYWLHGFTGFGLAAIRPSPWVPSLPELMDRVIAAGAPPAILVMADGWTRFGGSQYLNSVANGDYEDSLVNDLVPFIDRRYRTLPAAAHRGIDGKSSGGFGALTLGMRHPDVFSAIASHSGDCGFEYCYLPDFPAAQRAIEKAGGVDAYLDHFLTLKKKSDAIQALNIIAMAMAYSPNSSAGRYRVELPFDLYSGEIRIELWERWLGWDPVRAAEQHVEALRQARLLYFECGVRDQFNLHLGNRMLHRRLEALGVPHEYQEFDDNHSDINYRYVESLGRLARALAPD